MGIYHEIYHPSEAARYFSDHLAGLVIVIFILISLINIKPTDEGLKDENGLHTAVTVFYMFLLFIDLLFAYSEQIFYVLDFVVR